MPGLEITVRAVPLDPGVPDTDYLVECTICGPLGTFDNSSTDRECVRHLGWHGIDISLYPVDTDRE